MTFLVVAAIALLAFLRKGIFIRIITSPLLIVYGLRLAITDSVGSTLWMAGVIIAIIGTSLLFEPLIDEIRKRKRKGNGDEE